MPQSKHLIHKGRVSRGDLLKQKTPHEQLRRARAKAARAMSRTASLKPEHIIEEDLKAGANTLTVR